MPFSAEIQQNFEGSLKPDSWGGLAAGEAPGDPGRVALGPVAHTPRMNYNTAVWPGGPCSPRFASDKAPFTFDQENEMTRSATHPKPPAVSSSSKPARSRPARPRSAAMRTVHAAEDNTIRLASSAAAAAAAAPWTTPFRPASGPVKLYAMADFTQDRLTRLAQGAQAKQFGDRIDVPDDRQVPRLRRLPQGDRLPAARRRRHVHPRAYIPPHARRICRQEGHQRLHGEAVRARSGRPAPAVQAGEEAEKKSVKIAAGLQCRHSRGRQALIQQIRDGEMGEIQLIRANRMAAGLAEPPRAAKAQRAAEQLRIRPIHFFWVGSAAIFVE